MTVSDRRIQSVTTNIQEKSTLIWNVADTLRGPFKPHEYGLVILPMTVIKRFHDCLLPTHDVVLKKYHELNHRNLQVKDGFLRRVSGYQFYNTSPFTFETLLADFQNIESNFKAYLSGFSDNVQDILARFDFAPIIGRMVESGTLYQTVSEFNSDRAYMGPDRISAVDMGYIFEDLVRRFSESYDEEAGAHFTSRDIIYLMTDLLVDGDRDAFGKDGGSKTVYDMAMGTSQMLTCMEERIHQLDADTEVTCFGQEVNPQTFAIAEADMLIRGGESNNMRFGDTLSNDQFSGYEMSYVISNPPFGVDWKKEADAVEAEYKLGEQGRFAPGLPPKNDGQMLFMLNGIKKLRNEGRMAIIQNGSSLATGDAGSGSSEIRRFLIENDLLDAIVQLPNDAFYNTDIATYVWILEKNKPSDRAGKVQLIDASNCYEKRRKNIGKKRVDITDACRSLIVTAYGEFREKVYIATTARGAEISCESRIFDGEDFGYRTVVVESPMLDETGEPVLKNGRPVCDTARRDRENIPLKENNDAFMARDVLPYNPGAWIDESKTKLYYEIAFTRYFYKFKPIEPFNSIMSRIEERQKRLLDDLEQSIITRAVTKGLDPQVPMKESGVEWAGVCPQSWRMNLLFQLCDEVRSKNAGMRSQNLLSLSYGRIIEKDINTSGGLLPESFEGYNCVRSGDIVLRLTDLQNDHTSLRVGQAQEDGIITSAYTTLRPRNVRLSRFIYYALHAFDLNKGFYGMGSGVRQGLNYDEVKTHKIALPATTQEMDAIAGFLDNESREIDSIISEQQSLIDDLMAAKKSLIYECATGKRKVG